MKAHLILPTHKLLDAASEASKGKTKIGSTLKGIGPTYMDKTGRNGLRVGDISKPNFLSRYLEKLVVTALVYNRQQSPKKIREEIESEELDTPSEIQTCLKLGVKSLPERSNRSFLGYFFRSRSRRKTALTLQFELEKVVKFLENQLEVENDSCDRPVVDID